MMSPFMSTTPSPASASALFFVFFFLRFIYIYLFLVLFNFYFYFYSIFVLQRWFLRQRQLSVADNVCLLGQSNEDSA